MDGSTTPVTVVNNTVSGSHVYAAAGVKNLTLTVTDNYGGSGTNSLAVVVKNIVPQLISMLLFNLILFSL